MTEMTDESIHAACRAPEGVSNRALNVGNVGEVDKTTPKVEEESAVDEGPVAVD